MSAFDVLRSFAEARAVDDDDLIRDGISYGVVRAAVKRHAEALEAIEWAMANASKIGSSDDRICYVALPGGSTIIECYNGTREGRRDALVRLMRRAKKGGG